MAVLLFANYKSSVGNWRRVPVPRFIPTNIQKPVRSCTAPCLRDAHVPPKHTFLSTSCYTHDRKGIFCLPNLITLQIETSRYASDNWFVDA